MDCIFCPGDIVWGSYEPQSRGNSETCVKVQTSVESEQTCLILPPNKEHNSTLDSTQVNVQKVNPQDNMHVKKISDNISTAGHGNL
jgi:hypothetical protein